jgi:hypothetical protein
MATRTFGLEIKVMNVDTPERMEAVRTAMRRVAKQAFAACILICGDDPVPEIIVYQDDFENGRVDYDLTDDVK